MIKEVVNNDNPFSKEIQYIEDNNVLGELKYSLIYERMEVDNILVKEKYRGRGIGTKLPCNTSASAHILTPPMPARCTRLPGWIYL